MGYLGTKPSNQTPTYKLKSEFVATAGQTVFAPSAYTAGYIDVYRNGVKLGNADFTATNGSTATLAQGATAGDLITFESVYLASIQNGIPATAGAVSTSLIADNAITTAKIAAGAVVQADLATGVAGTGPAFGAYLNGGNQGLSTTTWTKVTLNAKEFDTASCFDTSTYRFTPNVAGYYQINGAVFYSGSAYASENRIAIYKNGSQLKQTTISMNGALINIVTPVVTSTIFMNGSTDYVELYAYSVNASSPICVSGSTNTYFSGYLARAA